MGETPPKEDTLNLPARLLTKCPGVAFDIGGSVCKIVYRNKADWKAFQEKKVKTHGPVRLVSFHRRNIADAFAFVKEHAELTDAADGSPTPICATGVGTMPFTAELQQTLNVKATTVMEMDCFVEAVRFVYQHCPWPVVDHDLRLPTDMADALTSHMDSVLAGDTDKLEAGRAYRKQLYKQIGRKVPGAEEEKPVKRVPGEPEEMDDSLTLLPCLIVTMGSAFAMLKVTTSDYYLYDLNSRGGKTFMGLGCLLTGVKTYDDLVDLAEKGDASKVTQIGDSKEFVDMPSFGLAEGKDLGDFKREDVAAALLQHVVRDCVQNIIALCVPPHNLRHAMLCGSFLNRESVRHALVDEWYRYVFQHACSTGQTSDITLHIMRHGAHLGALGCLINSVDPFKR